MATPKLFHVHGPDAFGYVHYAIVNGERVEVSRKDCPPPLATIMADNIDRALSVARLCYGRSVIVSTPGAIPATSYSGCSPTGAPR